MFKRFAGAVSGAIRGWKLSTNDAAFISWLADGSETDAGVTVNSDTAMRLATVYACIQKISKTIAQIPLHVYRKDGTKKIPATDHSLYSVLHRRANPKMTSYQFLQSMQWSVTSNGNGVSQIIRDGRGRVVQLWPWPIDKVRIEADGWDLKYFFQTKTGEKLVREEDVFHLPGICTKGRIGISPIQAARETLGEGIALQKHSQRFLKNGMRASGLIEVDPAAKGFSNEEDKKKWTKGFRESLSGENAYKIGILKQGMKFVQNTINNDDAQWIEQREFNQNEICSIFDIPPHLVGSLKRATFSNIEQQSLEYILYSIAPWLINWEQEAELQLMTAEESNSYSVKFNFDGLLRGDSNARWMAYWRSLQIGVLSPNEIRDLEDMNPYQGGDQRYVMKNLDAISNKPTEGKSDGQE